MSDSLDNYKGDKFPLPSPPRGGIKIADAFRFFRASKNFSGITIEDIVNTAGVNSALIYKYYGDKRGFLYRVLSDGMDR